MNTPNSTDPREAGKEPKRRDAYADCGRAARQALARWRAARLAHPLKFQVLVAVIELTATYSKLSDEVGVRQLAEWVYGVDRADLSRSQRQRVGDALRALRDLGIIEYAPGRGRYGRARIGLPPAEAESKTPPTSVIDDGADNSKTPPSDLKAPAGCDAKTPPGGATPSSWSEEIYPRDEDGSGFVTTPVASGPTDHGNFASERETLARRLYAGLNRKNPRVRRDKCDEAVVLAQTTGADYCEIDAWVGVTIDLGTWPAYLLHVAKTGARRRGLPEPETANAA